MKSLLDGDLLEQVTLPELLARAYRAYGVYLAVYPVRYHLGSGDFEHRWYCDTVRGADRRELNGYPGAWLIQGGEDFGSIVIIMKQAVLMWEDMLDAYMRL